jgi:hypothetical protein
MFDAPPTKGIQLKQRLTRRAAMAASVLTIAALPAVIGVQGASATAQSLSCGLGGSQTMNVTGTAPATATQGSNFTVDLQLASAVANGGSIENMNWYFVAPAGTTIVSGSVSTIGSGSGTIGAVSTSVSGQVVNLKGAGPVANGASFQMPLLRFQLNATGAVGTTQSVKVQGSPAYTLKAAGAINITCTAATPVAFTNTDITSASTAPGAPTGVTGTAGNASSSVSWTAPASNGGSAITGYTVTPYIGATAQTPQVFNSTATTQNVTGLTNGTAYTFKVKATNAIGTGVDSAASGAVTPRTVPGAPTDLTVLSKNGGATVGWTAPASNGGSAITGYTVTPYIGATAQTAQVFNSTATTQNLTGLTNGTAYTFKVAATNAAGTGTQSAASLPVVPTASKAIADFDGDGKTDISVFRPSNGGWFVSGSSVVYLGLNGDTPVPADYSGDGTSDRAIWRSTTGAWFVDGGAGATYHGIPGDVPVPGDYDGNGTADKAVWRPSNGGWYLNGGGVSYLGLSTDIPVAADYDGDGDVDRAVFRPSTGAWYVEGQAVQYFGANGDVPLPADYDGDGTTDLAVFRPSQGAWYIDGADTVYFGLGTDTPVPGQYDGDAATDIAVFRPSNGGWYIDGNPSTFFGLAGDIPAPKNPALS